MAHAFPTAKRCKLCEAPDCPAHCDTCDRSVCKTCLESHIFIGHKVSINEKEVSSYKKANAHYNQWAAERRKVIEDMKSLRDEIQRISIKSASDSADYGALGLASGGLTIAGLCLAPFTFGLSAAVTAAGTGAGIVSGIAGIRNDMLNNTKIKELSEEAISILKEHDEKGKEMLELLNLLENDLAAIHLDTRHGNKYRSDRNIPDDDNKARLASVCTRAFQVTTFTKTEKILKATFVAQGAPKMIKVGKTLQRVQRLRIKDVTTGVSKVSTGTIGPFAAVGILVDLGTVMYSLQELSTLKKGQLSAAAEKIQKIINELQNEFDEIAKIFK